MRRAHDNGRRAVIEKSKAAANDSFPVKRITETRARTKIVFVFGTGAGIDAETCEQRIWILDWGTSQALVVVTETEVERKFRVEAKIILTVERILRKVRVGRSSGGAGAGKVLGVSSGRVGREAGVILERVRAAENSREKIEDTIEVEIEAELPITPALQVRNIIDKLDPLDRRLARAEVIAADAQIRSRAARYRGADNSFRRRAVGEPGFFVACILKTKFVHDSLSQR